MSELMLHPITLSTKRLKLERLFEDWAGEVRRVLRRGQSRHGSDEHIRPSRSR